MADATRQKLPVYVNIYPDGHATLTCAHCAVDAGLEGAHAVALATEQRNGETSLVWHGDLTPEHLLGAAADQCMHLAPYRG